jgi:hypothetical protein
MLFLGLTVVIVVASLLGALLLDSWDYELTQFLSGVMSIISGCVLVVALCVLVGNHVSAQAEVEKYNSLKDTIENSRTYGSEVERASIVSEIADYNAKIASDRYWNNSIWFGAFIPEKLAELEPLE